MKKCLGSSDSGSSLAEYALIAALIAGVGLTGSSFLGGEVNTLFARLSTVMTTGQESTADDLGDHTATQSLNMSGFSIIGLAAPVNDTDAATKGYVDTAVSGSSGADNLGNHTATQILNMGTFRIASVGTPTDAADAATKGYVDSAIAGIPGGDNLGNHTATQTLEMSGQPILNAGSFAIGTNAPYVPLQVLSNSSDAAISAHSTDSSFSAYILTTVNSLNSSYFGVNTSNNTGVIGISSSSADLAKPGQNDIIVWNTSGHIGLGRIPTTNIDIQGTTDQNRIRLSSRFTGISSFTPELTSYANCSTSPTYDCGSLVLREVGYSQNSTTAGSHAPRLNFHWGNITAMSLWMDSTSTLNVGYGTNAAGAIRAASFISSSDSRLKENIEPIKDALQKLVSISGVSFRKIGNSDTELGVIAQEVETQFPELVSIDTNGYRSVNYPALVAPLIEAVKSLSEDNENLIKLHADLASRVEVLEQN